MVGTLVVHLVVTANMLSASLPVPVVDYVSMDVHVLTLSRASFGFFIRVQILGSTKSQSLKTNRRFLDPVCKNVFESIIVCKTYLQKPVSLQSVPKKCLITKSLGFRLLALIQRPRQKRTFLKFLFTSASVLNRGPLTRTKTYKNKHFT